MLNAFFAFLAQLIPNLIKMAFGTDKPMVTEVNNERPEKPLETGRTDADLLGDLGIRK